PPRAGFPAPLPDPAEREGEGARGPRSAHGPRSLKQALRWRSATATSGGRDEWHSSVAARQRGEKAQPGGSRARSGGWPSIGTRRTPASPSRRGTDAISPAV